MQVLPRSSPGLALADASAPGSDDGALVARVREGDRDAFAELVERHHRPLVASLCRLTGDPARAEDLAQEAFLRLWGAAGGYRDEGRLPAYLLRIGVNLLRSEERRAKRWRLLAPLYARERPAACAPRGQAAVLGAELGRALAAALAALPLRLRVPVVLREVEEWSYEAIAELLGCRPGTVKSRLHRGRERLRALLASHLETGDRP
jgi:RNA polymerase sigma-70 factor (ECF subfamily)